MGTRVQNIAPLECVCPRWLEKGHVPVHQAQLVQSGKVDEERIGKEHVVLCSLLACVASLGCLLALLALALCLLRAWRACMRAVIGLVTPQ